MQLRGIDQLFGQGPRPTVAQADGANPALGLGQRAVHGPHLRGQQSQVAGRFEVKIHARQLGGQVAQGRQRLVLAVGEQLVQH